MNYIIYKKDTGEIVRHVGCPKEYVQAQCRIGELPLGPLSDIDDGWTHVLDGQPVTDPTKHLENSVQKIRSKRNLLLASCDWTQLDDFPEVTGKQKKAWKDYRQALRDFPATCDPYNPVWPTPPE